MKLLKVKRPGGTFSFEMQRLGSDAYGEWLYAPPGSSWEAPEDAGTLSYDIVVLVQPQEWRVSWWIDDPADRSIAIDVCLPPERIDEGWTYVDLELDVVRHVSGVVEIEDHDESWGDVGWERLDAASR